MQVVFDGVGRGSQSACISKCVLSSVEHIGYSAEDC